jgi:copper resistance protein D
VIDWALRGARLLQFASTLVLFGSALFLLYGYRSSAADASPPEPMPSWVQALLAWASAVGVASALAWLLAEAILLTGTWTSWRDVLTGTRLGAALAVRAALLALAFVACVSSRLSSRSSLARRPARYVYAPISILGGLSVASFAWSGHGAIGSGNGSQIHLAADVLHLLSAGTWIGALLPMSVLSVRALRSRSPTAAADIAHGLARFSFFGGAVVLILILSGLANSWFLIGAEHWRALCTTGFGIALLVKVALFALMLTLALRHRYRTTPALQRALAEGSDAASILRRLRDTIVAETLLAFLVLADVAILGTLEPPAAS